MEEDRQLGLMFEMEQDHFEEEPTLEQLPEHVEPEIEIADPPEFSTAEQPPLFEDFAPVSKSIEPEIPWTEYIRMVQMFFDQLRFEEFQGQVSRLAVKYGTKNLTDTVAEAVRREAH